MDPETLYNPIAPWLRTQKKPFGSCMITHPRTVLIMRWSVDSACGLARAGDDRSRNALGQGNTSACRRAYHSRIGSAQIAAAIWCPRDSDADPLSLIGSSLAIQNPWMQPETHGF